MILLRLAMAAWGVIALLSGLSAMLFPGLIASLSPNTTNTFLLGSWGWLTAVLGLGVLLASRDPARHILWLQVALVYFVIGGLYDVLHLLIGTVDAGTVALDLAAYLAFGVLFYVLYPRSPRMVSTRVRSARGLLYTDIDRGGLFLKQGDSYIAYYAPLRRSVPSAPETSIPSPSAPPAASPDGDEAEATDAAPSESSSRTDSPSMPVAPPTEAGPMPSDDSKSEISMQTEAVEESEEDRRP